MVIGYIVPRFPHLSNVVRAGSLRRVGNPPGVFAQPSGEVTHTIKL
jgi:hypothetical protein